MEIFRFVPILKQTIWGGDKILRYKHIERQMSHVGESWELSGVRGRESVVAEGPHKGMTINEVVTEMGANLLGEENFSRFGNEFPLLIKFIDAQSDLSIQVHPDDATARMFGEERGKTEMWYIMDSDTDASIRIGLNRHITPKQYAEMVDNHTITDVINHYTVSEGDCFFIPAGTIHAICAGCFLAEIQQTSDVTYRIYDYNRKDKDGNLRQLHTREAAKAIDYTTKPDYHTLYTPAQEAMVKMVECPYFTTSVLDISKHITINFSDLDSFVVFIALKGEARIGDGRGSSAILRQGDTILLPATVQMVGITGKIKLLETHIKL